MTASTIDRGSRLRGALHLARRRYPRVAAVRDVFFENDEVCAFAERADLSPAFPLHRWGLETIPQLDRRFHPVAAPRPRLARAA